MNIRKPIIGVTADSYLIDQQSYCIVGEKYLRAITDVVEGIPFVLPPIPELAGYHELLDSLDGLLLTGSDSNVHPNHYNESKHYENMMLDPKRDHLVLPLITAALQKGLPILAICRGFQEMNVALGGSLYQMVHEVEGLFDHRENSNLPKVMRYEPAHPINIVSGGLLKDLINSSRIYVNSLHSQGIKAVAPSLRVEAFSDDGLVEAFSLPDTRGFNIAVQWHPEWEVLTNPLHRVLFDAFRSACCGYMDRQ